MSSVSGDNTLYQVMQSRDTMQKDGQGPCMKALEVKQTDWVVFSAQSLQSKDMSLFAEKSTWQERMGRYKRRYAVKPGKTKVQSSGSTQHAVGLHRDREFHKEAAMSVLCTVALFPVKHVNIWLAGTSYGLTVPTLSLIIGNSHPEAFKKFSTKTFLIPC